jgi:hypothetical protein
MYKIIGADQKEYGPVTANQVRQWLSEGRASMQTKVLPEGSTEWKVIGELPEFASAAPDILPAMPGAPAPSAAGAELVNGPAIGLIVLAIVGAILQIASMVFNIAGASLLAGSQMPKEAWANMFSGTMAVVSSIIGILVSGLILFGALKMKKLENHGLAMTVSIIAMIPCLSPCCVIGLPIGIWALVVLSKPEVKSAFH